MATQESSYGRLTAVSLGPGDPGWITRAGWQALEETECWAWPVKKVGATSYALEIVLRGGLEPPAHSLPLVFPMVRDRAALENAWKQAARETLTVLEQGRDVAFLIEGDGSFFATFGYLARQVKALQPAIDVTVIPGVSSPFASAAVAGVVLAEREECLAILPATVGLEKINHALDHFETVVLMKVKPVLKPLLELLQRRGIEENAVFVEQAGAPQCRVIRNHEQLAEEGVHYLSLAIITGVGSHGRS
ncbi:MAG: precorrin-2 C(20)-methyltransferase [Magnetococcales bacterium]|nr:precorrin-2 C(20)-methyltransferase [Magnetococcales bacterium]